MKKGSYLRGKYIKIVFHLSAFFKGFFVFVFRECGLGILVQLNLTLAYLNASVPGSKICKGWRIKNSAHLGSHTPKNCSICEAQFLEMFGSDEFPDFNWMIFSFNMLIFKGVTA